MNSNAIFYLLNNDDFKINFVVGTAIPIDVTRCFWN